MSVSGGENVYPAEVEDALQWHPEVAEVELIAFARGRLAGYKCPTAFDFVDVLPRNATGKVLRREFREPYWTGRERRIN